MKKTLSSITLMIFSIIGCQEDSTVGTASLVTPTVSISVNPRTIYVGDTVMVSWSSKNATKCFFDSTVEVSQSGRLVFVPQTTTIYRIRAVSEDSVSASASDTVKVEPRRYTLTVNTVGQGGVIKSPDAADYGVNEIVSLTAIAEPGWKFSGWSGAATGTSNPLILSMNDNKALTALFAQPQYYSLTAVSWGNGTVRVSPAQATYLEGTSVTITATPAAGSRFISWRGDTTGYVSHLTVTMDRNMFVAAKFMQYDPSLVAYYPFEGNADDESGNGHHGTVKGAILTTDRAGVIGEAYDFNNGSHIEVADSPELRLSEAFTIAAFIKVDRFNTGETAYGRVYGQHAIVSKISPGDWYGGYELRAVSDTTVVMTGVNLYVGAKLQQENVWYHVAFTWDGTQVRIYVNGIKVYTATQSGGFGKDTYPLRIGCRNGDWMWFDGSVDEVRLYNRVLADTEIWELNR